MSHVSDETDPHGWKNMNRRHNSLLRPVSKVRLQNAANGEYLELNGDKLVTRPKREGGNKIWGLWSVDMMDNFPVMIIDEEQGLADPVITMQGRRDDVCMKAMKGWGKDPGCWWMEVHPDGLAHNKYQHLHNLLKDMWENRNRSWIARFYCCADTTIKLDAFIHESQRPTRVGNWDGHDGNNQKWWVEWL